MIKFDTIHVGISYGIFRVVWFDDMESYQKYEWSSGWRTIGLTTIGLDGVE